MLFTLNVFFTAGCKEAEEQPLLEPQYAPDQLFPEYRITGTEERGEATVNIRFHMGGPDGPAVELPESASVSLDDADFTLDSSKMNGVYYENSSGLQAFKSKREITYTSPDAKAMRTPFKLPVFLLKTSLPEVLPRADLFLELEGLNEGTLVHTYFTDTSYMGRGLERLDTVKDARLIFTKNDLRQIHNGPVQLEIYVEQEKALEMEGWLSLYYGLRRDFLLVDSLPLPKRKR